jgi:hypothetical protein
MRRLGAALGLVFLVSKAQVRRIDLSSKNVIAGNKPRGFMKKWELVDEMVDVFQKLSG